MANIQPRVAGILIVVLLMPVFQNPVLAQRSRGASRAAEIFNEASGASRVGTKAADSGAGRSGSKAHSGHDGHSSPSNSAHNRTPNASNAAPVPINPPPAPIKKGSILYETPATPTRGSAQAQKLPEPRKPSIPVKTAPDPLKNVAVGQQLGAVKPAVLQNDSGKALSDAKRLERQNPKNLSDPDRRTLGQSVQTHKMAAGKAKTNADQAIGNETRARQRDSVQKERQVVKRRDENKLSEQKLRTRKNANQSSFDERKQQEKKLADKKIAQDAKRPASQSQIAGATSISTGIIDDRVKAAAVLDRNGLTKAGRSLTKHGKGARLGNSKFPSAKGNPGKINQQAQNIVNDILKNKETTIKEAHRPRFGKTIEYTAPGGRGIVYKSNGEFLFFIE